MRTKIKVGTLVFDGEFVCSRRQALNLRQRKFGEMIKASQATVSQIENGVFAVNASMQKRLEEVLECKVPTKVLDPKEPSARLTTREQHAVRIVMNLEQKQMEGWEILMRRGEEVVKLEFLL